MSDLPEPEFVSETMIPGLMARAIVIYFKGHGYVGIASNVPAQLVDNPYETEEEARASAIRLANRYLKGDSIDAYVCGRETKDGVLMECAWKDIQAKMTEPSRPRCTTSSPGAAGSAPHQLAFARISGGRSLKAYRADVRRAAKRRRLP